MKANFNKEMLLKYKFWIILGVSVIVILTGLFWLQFNDYAEAEVTKVKAAFTKVKGAKGEASPAFIASIEAVANKAGKSEATVWSNAYRVQEPLFTWPKVMEEKFEFQNGLHALNITINKLTDSKDWVDTDRVMHGRLIEGTDHWLKIENKDKKVFTFHRTKNVENITFADTNKAEPFRKLALVEHRDKLAVVTYQKGRYFGELLTDAQGGQHETYGKTYKSQVHEILKMVDPLDENDKGVVQLRNWRYRPNALPDDKAASFIRYVTVPWSENDEFSKEAWAAQENLWIQREIYRLIRQANDGVSVFTGKGGKERNKPYIFKNSALELHLSLNKDNSLALTVKNLLPKKQKLDLSFRVLMNEAKGYAPETIRISAPALAPKGDKSGKDVYPYTEVVKDSIRQGIFSVEQVITWEMAAVKRIDHISIGSADGADLSHSHRTFPEPLVPYEKSADAAPPAKGPPGIVVDPKQPGQKPGGAGGQTPFSEKGHGLWKERYLEVSEQSRRLPVAVVMIVDQSQVDRILTIFNNSTLRFLPTQVLLNHYAGSMQPPPLADKTDPMGVVNPMVNPFGKEGFRPPVGVNPPPGTPGGGTSEGNMELVIYGVVTLYERFPPRPPGDKK